MLTLIGDGLWLADGPVVHGMGGFDFPTRMAVVRLPGGGLWLWSPVALDPRVKAEVEQLGSVAHLVAPNTLHHMALGDWAAAFPVARVHGPPALAAKRPDIAFHRTLGPAPDPDWAGQVDQIAMPANRIVEEWWFHHRPSGTLLVTDLIQHLPQGWFRGWRGLVARMDGMSGPRPTVPRKYRMAFRDRAAVRMAFDDALAWHAPNVVMAHGAPVTGRGVEVLRAATAWCRA